ncbi:hypothetical protein HHL21_07500 [Massilia sp. RP-1-19]|uniref:Uncharacterized protein n=1 Tax=Massilia polaris TaxID=2728846 RepID=A0A848HL72_9BURK|nr:Imm27 family immunity protein [Massilia polaris]NML60930.1 hypothetical protein [Massilia polaris]
MKKIEPNETIITGHNIFPQGKIVGDEANQRILDLANGYLGKFGHDQSGWDTLYQDPSDGRFWELIYPESELQGGGPPSLVLI